MNNRGFFVFRSLCQLCGGIECNVDRPPVSWGWEGYSFVEVVYTVRLSYMNSPNPSDWKIVFKSTRRGGRVRKIKFIN